jgi:hypothetical protein
MIRILAVLAAACTILTAESCGSFTSTPQSSSGVTQTSVVVEKDAQGLTSEQHNVKDRLVEDNKPGAIKHLYVISAYSGQVLLYSTVRGKVTSSGKRLTPMTVQADAQHTAIGVNISPTDREATAEVLQDDGTYGTSVEYIYWWDTRGAYHQHYVSGGQIVHVTSQPLNVPHIVINIEKPDP